MSKIIYFASPYSDKDEQVVQLRVQKTSQMVAKLVSEGNVVISPIVYGHTLLQIHEMPSDWNFWKNFCQTFLLKCDEMIVYMLDGWDKSTGVLAEIELAKEMGMKVTMMPVMEKFLELKSKLDSSKTEDEVYQNLLKILDEFELTDEISELLSDYKEPLSRIRKISE